MLLHISEQSPDTLQTQIIQQLRARILSGDLAADAALPSIRRLAADLKVSVITVQRAYDALLGDGLIYARRGKGFYVAALKQQAKSELAAERLRTQLAQAFRAASADGLNDKTIRAVAEQCLAKGGNDEPFDN
jgi:GntR family transcriptional regulator